MVAALGDNAIGGDERMGCRLTAIGTILMDCWGQLLARCFVKRI